MSDSEIQTALPSPALPTLLKARNDLEAVDRRLTADDVKRIAVTLHAKLAVREKNGMPDLGLPVVYENRRFVVVDPAGP